MPALDALKEAWCLLEEVRGVSAFVDPEPTAVEDGSGRSLIALVGECAPSATLLRAFAPVWQAHGATLGRAPWLLMPESWGRLQALDPILTAAIHRSARVVWGSPLPAPAGDPAQALPIDQAAPLWNVSRALTAKWLDPASAAGIHQELLRLAARMDISGTDPAEIMSGLQSELAQILAAPAEPGPELPDAPELLPRLRAIYRLGDSLVLVLPDGDLALWGETDWQAVADSLNGECRQIVVATAAQFVLLARHRLVVERALNQLKHLWGERFLDSMPLERGSLYQQTGREVALLLHRDLARAYLTATDEQVGKLIHDFANRLHNLQLRHEIFTRLGLAPAVTPPLSIPERTAEARVRVEALFRLLDWWAGTYAALAAAT